ncbi:MAG: DUF2383 domain-containing protein [Verrucomicrobiaceae bacterium]|nr:MAG: DUF2383 domain-containing protein [Verrucomicrobiaceae bacterium]
MNDPTACIHACNKLLREELSAIETYTHAIGKCDEQVMVRTLDQIREDHEQNANILRFHLSSLGAVPASGSGAWGAFAGTVEGAAALLSDYAAIAALIGSERNGIREYENALENPHVGEEIKVRFRDENLPRLRNHVKSLEVVTGR